MWTRWYYACTEGISFALDGGEGYELWVHVCIGGETHDLCIGSATGVPFVSMQMPLWHNWTKKNRRLQRQTCFLMWVNFVPSSLPALPHPPLELTTHSQPWSCLQLSGTSHSFEQPENSRVHISDVSEDVSIGAYFHARSHQLGVLSSKKPTPHERVCLYLWCA